MTRRGWPAAALAIVLVLSSCASQTADGSPRETSPASVQADRLECEREGYPCSMDEVDPVVYELESTYMAEIQAILDGGTFGDALTWIRSQEGVVEAEGDDRQLAFRLEGGRPLFVIDSPVEVDGGAEIPTARLAAAVTSPTVSVVPPAPDGEVVGHGTGRDNPMNRKKALFLEPFHWELGPHFDEGIATLRSDPHTRDYQHEPDDIRPLRNEEVTPATFASWAAYDAVFVMSHGGNSGPWRWVASAQHEPVPGRGPDRRKLCLEYFAEYFQPTRIGLDCMYLVLGGPLEHGGQLNIVLGVSTEFFEEVYDEGGLDKAIVYIGGCGLMKADNMAAAVAGTTSAFFGWDDFLAVGGGSSVRLSERAATGLLRALIDLRLPAGRAYAAMATADLVHDPGNDSTLRLYDNGDGPKSLRLYDLPTPRDPGAPTAVLDDGAELRIEGVAGDGANDRLEIVVEVNGVIDPDATPSLEGPPDGGGNAYDGIVLASNHDSESAASLYDLRVYLDDTLVATDNLGDPRQPEAEASQLDKGVYGYSATLSLPFDVEPDGMEVTLRLEVELPEGGVSDYEVDIVLVEAVGATVTIGGQTWTFRPAAFAGGCITSTAEQVVMSGHVDADVQQSSLWADVTPAGGEITVADSETGLNWMAAADRASMTVLHLVPDGHSQIDEIIFDDGRVWGTATFIETRAFVEAWNTNGAYPSPVQGTFEIRCPTDATD